MTSEKSENEDVLVGSFSIENNIIKGAKKEFKLESSGIGKIILDVLDSDPNHVSQIDADTEKQTTNAEMKENSIRCALWLQKQEIRSNDVIVICTHNRLDAYIPCLATFLVGAVYNPWHHEVPLKTARHLMSLIRPKIIFASESSVDVLKESAKLENIDTRIILFEKRPGLESLKDLMRLQTADEIKKFKAKEIKDQEGPAMILFSSGTTGLPKGVAHSHKTLVRTISSFNFLPKKTTVSLWYSSLYWISGTIFMLQSLATNATRIIHANFDPKKTCEIIEKYQINWFFITPTMVTVWSKTDVCEKYELKTMKTIITGGAKLSSEVLQKIQDHWPHISFNQVYGMTEICGVITLQTNKREKIDSVGFIVANSEIKIVDLTNGKALGPNEPGEIYIKSPSIMICYYKNPRATKETVDDQGWIRTGDLGYYSEIGEVYIKDRLKEVMKFRGHQISPSEIEETLLSHPAVMEVAVVPVPHELDLERPMAFVKKFEGAKVSVEELVQLSAELGDYKKLWGGVKFLEEIPHTASGKIDRKYLREMAKTYAS